MQFEPASILDAAAKLGETFTRHRRALHRRPELGFAEHETAAYIEAELDRLAIPSKRSVGTGVVAVIEGSGAGCIGLRADMDALPVTEAVGRDGYRSEIEGLSHACGHDAHVAVALGVAELLRGVERLPGTVVLYFQPAEEGPGGAEPMVAAGVLEDPAPQAVIALHVASEFASGKVGVRVGPFTAATDEFDIVVHGVGGHAAHPDWAVDPVPVAAEIVLAAQRLVTREVNPVTPVVLTFGTISGGNRHNVIPPYVRLSGTFRTLHQQNRELLTNRLPELVRGIAEAHRASAEVIIDHSYPLGANDAELTTLIEGAARGVLGDERVFTTPAPSLGGEDFFAFGATGIPVSMFLLGVANPVKGITGAHHSPAFDLDEDALPTGVAVMAETIRRFLESSDG